MIWILLAIILLFVILDKTKVLRCNTLAVTLLYLIGMPLALCAYFVLFICDIIKLIDGFSILRCISIAGAAMVSVPLVILLAAVIVRITKTPIERDGFSGSDEEYNAACAKRQRLVLWICYPIAWISAVVAAAFGIYLILNAAVVAAVLVINPFFWFVTVVTFGLALIFLVVYTVGYVAVPLVVFLLFGTLYVIYTVITVVMTITILYRIRNYSGYSKVKCVVMVISMLVPIWSLFTLIELTMKLKEITRN